MGKLVASVAIVILSTAAIAHGDDHKPGATAAVTKEQQAWGIAGDASSVTRTVVVRMSDAMRFAPDRLEVEQGQTIRIVVRNRGKLKHEFVLGTRAELDAHAAMMEKFPGMEHDEPYLVHVPPGQSREIVWNFNRAGVFLFGCLIAGHYSAGMIGEVKVLAR